MPKNIKIAGVITLLLLCGTGVFAQMQEKPVEMADAMRSNGKIYVVVAVLTTILAGIILFLVRLERRIKELEKK